MNLHPTIRRTMLRRLMRIPLCYPPDFIIGDGYLYRWWIIPRNPVFNIYLHCIAADDDDRALHDHPWLNVSILLKGRYWEHLPGGVAIERKAGAVVWRRATAMHRLSLADGCDQVWSLFITGPKIRTWGFQCPQGWIPWHEFVDAENPGQPGKGCD